MFKKTRTNDRIKNAKDSRTLIKQLQIRFLKVINPNIEFLKSKITIVKILSHHSI